MTEIGFLPPEQMRELWQWYLSQKQLAPHQQKNYPQRRPVDDARPRHAQCELLEDLFAANDSWTAPETAQAMVYEKFDGSDQMQASGREITIVNRHKHISIDAGTYIKAEWIDGEWQPYTSDCPGGSSSDSGSE